MNLFRVPKIQLNEYTIYSQILRRFSVLFLFGCSIFEDKRDKEADWSAKKFYEEAKAALDRESYDKAIKLYEKLEARYPFGLYAAQAQLDIAYAYYKFQEPDSAIAAADRFIKLHPAIPTLIMPTI